MRTALVLSVSLVIAPAALLPAEEARFRPEVCFPPGILYGSIANASRLEEQLAGTLLGRMATHPGVRKALEGCGTFLKEKMGAGADRVAALTGKSPLETLRLVRGEAALSLGITQAGMPALAVAIELGESKAEILEVRARLRAAAEQAGGKPLETASIEDVEATLWPGPAGPVLDAVLGTHLVIASQGDLFESIAKAHRARAAAAEPRESALDPDLARELAVSGRQALLLVDIEALRSVLLGTVPEWQRENVENVLRVVGLDRVTSLGGALGFRDGGAETAWRLGMRNGAGGILAALVKSLPGLGNVDEALGRIPGAADEVQAGRMDVGGLLRGIDRALRDALPELADELDGNYRELERFAGVSVTGDLFAMGDVTAYSYAIGPPAGGLFPDEVILLETAALEPCWRVLEKIGARLGAKPRDIGARAVTYLNLSDGKLVDFLREAMLGAKPQGVWTPSFPELLAMTAASGFARADAGEGWTAASTLPQAVIRHLEIHSKGPRLGGAADGELASILRRESKGAAAVLVSRGGRGILAIYNSILPLANAFYPILKAAGFDPAELPAGESFLPDVKPGYLRLSVDPKGFTLRGHRALETRAGVLAGAAVASMAAGFLVPTLTKGREQAQSVQCMSNLKQLYSLGLLYSDRSGTRAFPHSEEGPLASLQLLVDSDPAGIHPALFVCPIHGASAPVREGGKTVLTPETTSYEAVPWRLKNTALEAIWLFDREPVHHGKRNVLFTDGSVLQLSEEEFQRKLEENRERFSSPDAAPKKRAPGKAAKKKKKATE